MLSINDALHRVLSSVQHPIGSEWCLLNDLSGRILAEDILSHRTLPPFDNSAMDGYALKATDALPGTRLTVVDEQAAGSDIDTVISSGQAVRIFTGAPVPSGCDTVIMQEQTEREGIYVKLSGLQQRPEAGQHIRRRGHDVAAGSVLLEQGCLVGPGEIGLLAACSRSGAVVRRRPRVLIIATGSELKYVDEPVGPGQIVNSNSLALVAAVEEAGGRAHIHPIVADTEAAHHQAFDQARGFDLVVSSGGVSVGDHDLIQPVLEQRGWQKDFWKIAMKPGKPVLFGRLKDGPAMLGLPGNPASSLVAFELYGRPLIRRMLSHPRALRQLRAIPLAAGLKKRAGRTHVMRGRIENGEFHSLKEQGSGFLRSMAKVPAWAFVPAERTEMAAGELVRVLDRAHDGGASAESFQGL